MNPVEIIFKKREGKSLTDDELSTFVTSYLSGKIPEYQMSALLMAIFFKDMNPDETKALTRVYVNSGKTIQFPSSWNTVDKHSTGGVGDKITLTLAPVVAACGVKIPMISGRGLGHTGGTLDKLESIPGFRTDYSSDDFANFVNKSGMAIVSQSEELVPADKRIYALRDVTATVESLPLITASIMSKKIAEGAQNLVIDLKVGTGAFIKTMEKAQKLAGLLVSTGEMLGQKVAVVFSRMNSPLGKYIGNALEIIETIEYLKGDTSPDIDILTKELAIQMLLIAGKADNRQQALMLVQDAISSGRALDKFRELIIQQSGNPLIIDDLTLLPQCRYKRAIIAEKSGWIKQIDSQTIGYSLILIGAGRLKLDSKLNYGAGLKILKKIGDRIEEGEILGEIFYDDSEKTDEVVDRILKSFEISETITEQESVIIKVINRYA